MIGPGELFGLGVTPYSEHGDPFHVDGFAGGGGASVGYEIGTRRRVKAALNHCPEALRMHRANHPLTRHFRADIRELDPVKVCGGRQPRSAWFSPDCKDFSKAKGGKPKSKRIRGLAWVVIHWVNTVRPLAIFMENVEEFADWCPLLPNDKRNPWRRAWFFNCFVGALRRRGYHVEWKELRARDYGAPTIRKRFFLVARCDGEAIHWPAPTHGPRASEAVKSGSLKPYVEGWECLDFTLPCPSIFLGKGDARRLRVKRPLAKASLARIAKGVDRFVLKDAEPFLVSLTHQGGNRVESLREPLRTITGARRGEKALVTPFLAYGQQGGGLRAGRDQVHTITASPKDTNGIVAVHFARQFGTGIGHTAREPHRTIMADGGGKSLVVSCFLAQHNTGVVGHSLRKPVSTVTARGTQQQLVALSLVKYYGTDQTPRLDEPLHTVTTKDRFGLTWLDLQVPPLTPDLARRARRVARFLREHGVEFEGEFATVGGLVIVDIGMRMLTARELFRAQGFPNDYVIGDDPTSGLILSKTAQVRMCGNSVPPPLAAAIIRANLPELVREEVAA